MFSFLKNHPFAVEAFFENSIVLTFAFPKEDLSHFIPKCLKLDTFDDKWAFIAVAIVQTKELRPKGFPKFLGNDFTLVGYRVFVKYTNNAGKNLRGLYILESSTDKKMMKFLGNLFTHYNYTTTDITQTRNDILLEIRSIESGFFIHLETGNEAVDLPGNSPFSDWKEARRFAGPLPFTFTYLTKIKKVLIIEGVRENWIPKPIKVIDYHIPFLSTLRLTKAVLANAFIINKIPYHWKKGKIEQWNH
jgi:Uncharacterized conserved protein (COG2071)